MNAVVSTKAKPDERPDLTPMIDVVFQLLIFFMVTAVFAITPGLDIKLPEAEEAQAPDKENLFIVVDQDGKRYMNECTPYTHDTSHRHMEHFDSVRQSFPRVPSYLVFDQVGCDMYQIGAPTYNQPGLGFAWSEDNMKEVEMGII